MKRKLINQLSGELTSIIREKVQNTNDVLACNALQCGIIRSIMQHNAASDVKHGELNIFFNTAYSFASFIRQKVKLTHDIEANIWLPVATHNRLLLNREYGIDFLVVSCLVVARLRTSIIIFTHTRTLIRLTSMNY